MAFFEARFDSKMDTTLALTYLEKKKDFHSIGFEDNGQIVLNSFNNKIFCSEYNESQLKTCDAEDFQAFITLAEKIYSKKDLFCQLEFLIRDIPMEYVEKFDIELIKQNFIYHGMYGDGEKVYDSVILMSDDSALADLGCIVSCNYPVTIICTVKTAIICSLFVDLCNDVGLPGVHLCIVSNIKEPFNGPMPRRFVGRNVITGGTVPVYSTGCTGVVTEYGDVDSAVDTFLLAPVQRPWRVKRIFVQESVVRRFENALAWKCSKIAKETSSSAYSFEKKLFQFEYVGSDGEIENSTVVEAYRTVKELMSLLKKINPFCLSLWSNNVSESNEISNEVKATLVWINCYGHLDNPQPANAFYSLIHQNIDISVASSILSQAAEAQIINSKNDWLKLEKHVRYITIRDILIKFASVGIFEVRCRSIIDSHNASYSVGKTVCFAIKKPVDFVLLKLNTDNGYVLKEKHIHYVIDGGAIVFLYNQLKNTVANNVLEVFEQFKMAKVPIFLKNTNVNIDDISDNRFLLYKTKAIWSSIGTVFAN